MLGERRLTTDLNGRPIGTHIDPMHRENIKRIKNAYKHPFERIPDEYFDSHKPINNNPMHFSHKKPHVNEENDQQNVDDESERHPTAMWREP